MSNEEIQAHGRETIANEADAIARLLPYADEQFAQAVNCIQASNGRVVVSGIGKSAVVAQKIAATMNSTGTPALFMHAADAIHGDLGMIQKDDTVIVISKSGNSPEIKALVPLIKNFGNPLIAICGNTASYLAQNADILVNSTIEKEACPHNLAPTTSTTAQMVMGDALAVSLLHARGFSEKDFARYHPGGALGKRLYLRVGDLSAQNAKPAVQPGSPLSEVIYAISSGRMGATAVLAADGTLAGVITDGDLRRMLEKNTVTEKVTAAGIMSPNPRVIDGSALATAAMALMRQYDISVLLVTEDGAYAGMVHLHDLIREVIN